MPRSYIRVLVSRFSSFVLLHALGSIFRPTRGVGDLEFLFGSMKQRLLSQNFILHEIENSLAFMLEFPCIMLLHKIRLTEHGPHTRSQRSH
jgi:hypothetical protein